MTLATIRSRLPSWLVVIFIALSPWLVAGLVFGIGYLIGAASRPDEPAPATVAHSGTVARYQVATQPGYGWACLVAWDVTDGQVWVFDQERGTWRSLPALPAERNEP